MTASADHQYRLIEQAIEYLAAHHDTQPTLAQTARQLGLSEYYFQRLFRKWVGISPKRFLQFLNKEYIKTLLDQGYSVSEACYEAGLSSTSRSHELFVSTEAISPAQYRSLGRNLRIAYGFHESPFGEYLLAVTPKGICHLAFVIDDRKQEENRLRDEWRHAEIRFDPTQTEPVHRTLFPARKPALREVTLLLRGTNFQIQVWQALLQIPFGHAEHYEGLAGRVNRPSAVRACASAVARNRIAWLIPCHRVVRKVGESGKYRWGRQRKAIMLAFEGAKRKGTL